MDEIVDRIRHMGVTSALVKSDNVRYLRLLPAIHLIALNGELANEYLPSCLFHVGEYLERQCTGKPGKRVGGRHLSVTATVRDLLKFSFSLLKTHGMCQ